MSIIKYQYHGFEIQFEEVNGQVMANATLMCQAFESRPNDWLRLTNTKRYIAALEALQGKVVTLVETRKGGQEPGGTTWIHEKLILKLAQWLSVDFEVWCDDKLAELLRTGKVELKPMSPTEMLVQSAQILLAQEQRLNAIETKVKEIEAKAVTSPTNYYTVAGYASIHGVKIDSPTAAKLGKKTSSLCTANGYMIGKTHDPRFGSVNTYPVEVLDIVFAADGYCIIE